MLEYKLAGYILYSFLSGIQSKILYIRIARAFNFSSLRIEITVNSTDREDLKLIIYRLDVMAKEMEVAHSKTRVSLKFIKENLFDPDSGLWAETKRNSNFRETSSKALWVFVPAFIATFFKVVWDSLKG